MGYSVYISNSACENTLLILISCDQPYTKNMFECVYSCPYGWLNDPQKACGCAPAVVTKYQKGISVQLLDRIDIHIEVPRVDFEKLSNDRVGESGDAIHAFVQAVHAIQNSTSQKEI